MNTETKDPIIKKRKFGLEAVANAADIPRMESVLGGMNGMLRAEISLETSVLLLEYNLRQVKFVDLEKVIEKSGLRFSRKRFERWKRGMAKFTEQNELDNLNAPASSCCEVPSAKAESCRHCASSGKGS